MNRLHTDRLFLRPFRLSDAGTALLWLGDPAVMKWIPGGALPGPDAVRERLRIYLRHFEEFGYAKYILLKKDTGEAVGDCGLMNLPESTLPELGFRIRTPEQGKGYATEAALSVLRHAFEDLGLPEVRAIAEPENKISLHILEQKLGFSFLGNATYYNVVLREYGLKSEQFTRFLCPPL